MIGKPVNLIEDRELDELVKETYGRIYCFQQQDGCKERGIYQFSVPVKYPEDYENDSIPEIINGEEMGVSFKAWLERDPNAPLNPSKEELESCAYFYHEDKEEWCKRETHIQLFYLRNFYPNVDMIINDLHERGLLPEGDYLINIDW